MRTMTGLLMSAVCLLGTSSLASEANGGAPAFLFASFRGNGEDGLHLAYSRDGLQWTALKNDTAFLKPTVGGKLMRDPCILRGPDGVFHMAWTTSWGDKGIGIAHSSNLVDWSAQKFVPVMEHEATARNCWAPEIAWDPKGGQYVLYWATTFPDRFKETEQGGDKGWNHRIYFTTTRDFETYTKAALLYDPGFNSIDATIAPDGDRFVMILKDETLLPPAKNLRVARSESAVGPWGAASPAFSPSGKWVEGPSLLKTGEGWIVYYDEYTAHRYGAMRTRDFKTWEEISAKLSFPKGTRHGTAFPVPAALLKRLLLEQR